LNNFEFSISPALTYFWTNSGTSPFSVHFATGYRISKYINPLSIVIRIGTFDLFGPKLSDRRRRFSLLGTASAMASASRKSFFCPFENGRTYFAGINRASCPNLQLTTEMMRPNAGLHADQARRQIGEPGFDLATRPLLPQHDGTAPVLAHDVK
jgi:hypothetical protein